MKRGSARLVAAAFGVAGFGGCTVDTGVVEVAWVFVDRDGDAIFPGGLFDGPSTRDACDLPARGAAGSTAYDLTVALEICDPTCAAGCEAQECLVVPPLAFDCRTSRGSDSEIPSSPDPYRFTLRPIINPIGAPACSDPAPTCLAAPGPRERTVGPGLTVDLQVYQFIVDVDTGAASSGDRALDLEACGCDA